MRQRTIETRFVGPSPYPGWQLQERTIEINVEYGPALRPGQEDRTGQHWFSADVDVRVLFREENTPREVPPSDGAFNGTAPVACGDTRRVTCLEPILVEARRAAKKPKARDVSSTVTGRCTVGRGSSKKTASVAVFLEGEVRGNTLSEGSVRSVGVRIKGKPGKPALANLQGRDVALRAGGKVKEGPNKRLAKALVPYGKGQRSLGPERFVKDLKRNRTILKYPLVGLAFKSGLRVRVAFNPQQSNSQTCTVKLHNKQLRNSLVKAAR